MSHPPTQGLCALCDRGARFAGAPCPPRWILLLLAYYDSCSTPIVGFTGDGPFIIGCTSFRLSNTVCPPRNRQVCPPKKGHAACGICSLPNFMVPGSVLVKVNWGCQFVGANCVVLVAYSRGRRAYSRGRRARRGRVRAPKADTQPWVAEAASRRKTNGSPLRHRANKYGRSRRQRPSNILLLTLRHAHSR